MLLWYDNRSMPHFLWHDHKKDFFSKLGPVEVVGVGLSNFRGMVPHTALNNVASKGGPQIAKPCE